MKLMERVVHYGTFAVRPRRLQAWYRRHPGVWVLLQVTSIAWMVYSLRALAPQESLSLPDPEGTTRIDIIRDRLRSQSGDC